MKRQELVSYCYESPVGIIEISADTEYLRQLTFNVKVHPTGQHSNWIIEETVRQLEEYFNCTGETFQLPLALEDYTDFQRLVWKELTFIPLGDTASYKEIAIAIDRPGSCRAVGNACGQNMYPIIIPCHRVISGNGTIGGFSADIRIKKWLLEFEKRG